MCETTALKRALTCHSCATELIINSEGTKLQPNPHKPLTYLSSATFHCNQRAGRQVILRNRTIITALGSQNE